MLNKHTGVIWYQEEFRWCQEGVEWCQEVPRVYFERLLARPEYILKDSSRAQSIFLKDSWQEAYVIHMENKDLHVAIVFSPICGPKSVISSVKVPNFC